MSVICTVPSLRAMNVTLIVEVMVLSAWAAFIQCCNGGIAEFCGWVVDGYPLMHVCFLSSKSFFSFFFDSKIVFGASNHVLDAVHSKECYHLFCFLF